MLAFDDLEAYDCRAVSMKRRMPGNHDVENDAERKKIRAPVDGLAYQLFGCHVRWGAKQPAGEGEMGQVQLGNTEISDLGPAILSYQCIPGLNCPIAYHPGVG